MKIRTLLSMIASAATLFACSDDDKVTYDPANTQAAVLQAIEENIVLDESTAADISFTFQWQKAEFGFDASVTYVLEMDIKDNDFANPQKLSSSNSTSMAISGENINLAMASLQLIYGFGNETAQTVQFRVSGKISDGIDPVYSNVVESTITPYVTKAIPLPTTMYLIGSMCDWNWEKAIQLTNVHSGAMGEGKFWTIQYLEAGAEFKFNSNKDWDGSEFCGELADETYASIPNNIKVEEAGYYQIMVAIVYVDETKQSVKQSVIVTKPNVYLMGECTDDGWTTGAAASKFTVDDANKVLISPALANTANLRMYAEVPKCDWWGSEFNIYEGKIVLRGTGDDQAAVSATAGKTVKLNFTDMTGVIE